MPDQVATVDDYLHQFPEDVRVILEELRRRLGAITPGTGEAIRYQMPTITLNGRSVVHFAGWKHHVALYPVPDGDPDYERDIAPYRSGKSTVKFAYSSPMPYELIERMVRLLIADSPTPPG
jgi:uncharacterized protein YdhG (YjbR/CyaY superfamily)